MSNETPTVRVGVVWVESKGRYLLKWKDPRTGKYPTKSTDLTKQTPKNLRKALQLAEKLQEELIASLEPDSTDMSWDEFRKLYESERLPRKSIHNLRKWNSAAHMLEERLGTEIIGPIKLSHITPMRLIRIESHMRTKLSAGSIGSYMATLRAGLNWAAKVGLMSMLPPRPPDDVDYELPAMRLRPITLEDLERMEFSCASVVGKQHAPALAEFIRCLYLSGCRLADPLLIHAYRQDFHHPIVLDGDRPMMAWTNRQKNRKDQFVRITMDFAAFLKARMDRDGMMFNPTNEHGRIECIPTLSDLISAVGKKANVIAEPGEPGKTATAKHFRSSFVTRWSLRGMPLDDIGAMARHASRSTTEKHYLAPIRPDAIKEFRESDWLVSDLESPREASKSETA